MLVIAYIATLPPTVQDVFALAMLFGIFVFIVFAFVGFHDRKVAKQRDRRRNYHGRHGLIHHC